MLFYWIETEPFLSFINSLLHSLRAASREACGIGGGIFRSRSQNTARSREKFEPSLPGSNRQTHIKLEKTNPLLRTSLFKFKVEPEGFEPSSKHGIR